MPQPNAAAPSRIFDPSQGSDIPNANAGDPNAETPSSGAVDRDPTTGRWLKPGFTGSLVGRAKRLGITDGDLRDMSAADLREEVRGREMDARLEKVLNVKDTMTRFGEQSREAIKNTPQPLDLGIDDENTNPLVVAAIRKVTDHYEAKLQKLEERLGKTEGFAEQSQARETQSFERRVEKQFSKYPEIFGHGSAAELRESNPAEFHLRMAAVAAHAAAGGLPEDLDDNIDQFVSSKFGGRKQQPAARGGDDEQDPLDEISQWQQGVLNRPTQAGPREAPAGRAKAVQGVRSRVAASREDKPQRGIYLRHNQPSQPPQNGQNGQR